MAIIHPCSPPPSPHTPAPPPDVFSGWIRSSFPVAVTALAVGGADASPTELVHALGSPAAREVAGAFADGRVGGIG